MSWSASKSTKCCATCANWGGNRTRNGEWAVADTPGAYGKCYAGVFSAVTNGHAACGERDCPKYQLWAALK